ncbi:MAG TPA: co-chaperone GroES [Myxococcota bacterium]|jgi:chaperonin GroES|nr:co-chaperone GroES [Myxococcota bacterium]HOS62705.1 co-chaperone GroES [Myxococcota bacterium]HPC92506.1 co-chaperone GroES [Myxococcota bacterium]HPL25847.1 co-chaperone GroES [Myxococcota bacterium]HQC45344.1 co-chaperone GroES [Myxococcota bacterium]
MKLRPLHDRIVVKRAESEELTAGGLYIPETAKEKPQQAVVVAAGPGRTLDNGQIRPPSVKVGDRVLFSMHAGREVKVDGETYLIMYEDDVLAVLEDK